MVEQKQVIEKIKECFDEYVKSAETVEFPRLLLFENGLEKQLKMYENPNYVLPDSEFQALLRVAEKIIGFNCV